MGQIQYIHNQLQAINLQYCLFWSSLWYFNEQLGEMKKIKNCLTLALEVWSCEMELVNPYDKCLVAVKNQDGNLVGHVPKELSRLFHKFLDDFGELEAECIGNRLNALWAMMYIWESSRGDYLRRTLLMISTWVKFSESQKAKQDKKRPLFKHKQKEILICCI